MSGDPHIPQSPCSGATPREDAVDGLIHLVYDQVRALAREAMRRERPDHTLQATAIANEVYLRLKKENRSTLHSREQVLALAARVIRRILVDHARGTKRLKRGAGIERVTLSDVEGEEGAAGVDLLALEDAMIALEARATRQARVVELRYFAGLSMAEIATVLGVSKGTVEGDWSVARAWLQVQMAGAR